MFPLGVCDDGRGMDLFSNGRDEAAVDEFVTANDIGNKPFLVFHTGCHQTIKKGFMSGAAKRTWPAGHWAGLVRETAERTGVPPVLTGASKGDLLGNEEIRRLSGVETPFFTGRGMGLLAALLRRAAAFASVDTGPLHAASAVGIPTVALFGPSQPSLTGPYRNPGVARILQKKLDCAPCKGKGIRCHDNECMKEITPQEVCDALLEIARAGNERTAPKAGHAGEGDSSRFSNDATSRSNATISSLR